MVNINPQRNLPPDNTPWGKAIERRLSNLERGSNLLRSETNNTSRALDQTINRYNIGAAKRLVGDSGQSYGDFPVPSMPSTSPDYSPTVINSYATSQVGLGTKLVIVTAMVENGRLRLTDNSPANIQHYTIFMRIDLASAPQDESSWWGRTSLIPLRVDTATGPNYTWSSSPLNFTGIGEVVFTPSMGEKLYLRVADFYLNYGGNEIDHNTSIDSTMRIQNPQVIVVG